MQEILDRRQKYLLELNAKQAQHAKLREEFNKQIDIAICAHNKAQCCIESRETNKLVTSCVLGTFSLIGGGISARLAFSEGSVAWGCATVACATWFVIGWKGVAKFFDWKYSVKINNLIVEYQGEANRLNELKQQSHQLVGEINGLKANIKGCDEELRMMRCLTKVKSQKQELEMER